MARVVMVSVVSESSSSAVQEILVAWDFHQCCSLIWVWGFQWREVQLGIRTKCISCPSWNSPQEHSHNESRWRRERELETLLGPDPSATFINHSTGQNNRLLLMRLTILRRCLQCHGSWLALIQLTITESSNQHASLQSGTTVKLMRHTVHTLKDHKKSLF